MKTTAPKPPSSPLALIEEELSSSLALKAQFCCAALTGRLATQPDATFECSMGHLVDEAYALGELMFTKFCAENNSTIQHFNEKLGL
jgi:hypothetical protein